MTKKLHDPPKQKVWLEEHIPHRVRASLTWTTHLDQLLATIRLSQTETAQITGFCAGMAVWEGKHASMRWLIEFIGITANAKTGMPNDPHVVRKNRQGKKHTEFDVDITDLPGGEFFDHTTDDAKYLAGIWKGCSQATGHPTDDSNHPAIGKRELDKAIRMVIAHLAKTIYAHAGSDLTKTTFQVQ